MLSKRLFRIIARSSKKLFQPKNKEFLSASLDSLQKDMNEYSFDSSIIKNFTKHPQASLKQCFREGTIADIDVTFALLPRLFRFLRASKILSAYDAAQSSLSSLQHAHNTHNNNNKKQFKHKQYKLQQQPLRQQQQHRYKLLQSPYHMTSGAILISQLYYRDQQLAATFQAADGSLHNSLEEHIERYIEGCGLELAKEIEAILLSAGGSAADQLASASDTAASETAAIITDTASSSSSSLQLISPQKLLLYTLQAMNTIIRRRHLHLYHQPDSKVKLAPWQMLGDEEDGDEVLQRLFFPDGSFQYKSTPLLYSLIYCQVINSYYQDYYHRHHSSQTLQQQGSSQLGDLQQANHAANNQYPASQPSSSSSQLGSSLAAKQQAGKQQQQPQHKQPSSSRLQPPTITTTKSTNNSYNQHYHNNYAAYETAAASLSATLQPASTILDWMQLQGLIMARKDIVFHAVGIAFPRHFLSRMVILSTSPSSSASAATLSANNKAANKVTTGNKQQLQPRSSARLKPSAMQPSTMQPSIMQPAMLQQFDVSHLIGHWLCTTEKGFYEVEIAYDEQAQLLSAHYLHGSKKDQHSLIWQIHLAKQPADQLNSSQQQQGYSTRKKKVKDVYTEAMASLLSNGADKANANVQMDQIYAGIMQQEVTSKPSKPLSRSRRSSSTASKEKAADDCSSEEGTEEADEIPYTNSEMVEVPCAITFLQTDVSILNHHSQQQQQQQPRYGGQHHSSQQLEDVYAYKKDPVLEIRVKFQANMEEEDHDDSLDEEDDFGDDEKEYGDYDNMLEPPLSSAAENNAEEQTAAAAAVPSSPPPPPLEDYIHYYCRIKDIDQCLLDISATGIVPLTPSNYMHSLKRQPQASNRSYANHPGSHPLHTRFPSLQPVTANMVAAQLATSMLRMSQQSQRHHHQQRRRGGGGHQRQGQGQGQGQGVSQLQKQEQKDSIANQGYWSAVRRQVEQWVRDEQRGVVGSNNSNKRW